MRIFLLLITLLFTISCNWLFKPAMSQATAPDLMAVENGDMDVEDVEDEMPVDLFASSDGEDGGTLEYEDLDSLTIDSTQPLGFAGLESPFVRIALKQKSRDVTLSIENRAQVRSKELKIRLTKGTLQFSAHSKGIQLRAHGKKVALSLPCTLFVGDNESWGFDKRIYAEYAVFTPHDAMGFNLLNVLKVESYLRGVVPLEIGTRSTAELEALKAQAVAARTYTYKRMSERKERTYDLLPTVADQVYGGVGVAHAHTDSAIMATAGEVMVDNSRDLIGAFYHSTCGGHTAGIDEVWNSKYTPYLRGGPDVRPNGRAWCFKSTKLYWTEEWSVDEFSKILRIYGPEKNAAPFQGTVRGIAVTDRTRSGRVKNCRVSSNHGTYFYGKDKVRQVFRRAENGHPILWSAKFKIELSGNRVIAHGKGFGHGIGMCQMGALGRAQGGQTYKRILDAYYTGAKIEKIVMKDANRRE